MRGIYFIFNEMVIVINTLGPLGFTFYVFTYHPVGNLEIIWRAFKFAKNIKKIDNLKWSFEDTLESFLDDISETIISIIVNLFIL